MYKFFVVFIISWFSGVSLFGQNQDTTNISITNFRITSGTYSWRGTNTFFDRTSWDSSPYTEGNLQQLSGGNWLFRQNFRLLYPQGYDPGHSPGYPMIVMFHGAGERGNCWIRSSTDADCHYGTTAYQPKDEPVGATQNQINNLLNNDQNLAHGGSQHLTARNLAGTKKPEDPTLDERAFPGFIFFPQNLNGWNTGDRINALRTLRLLMKQLNIDPNRIYIHGLSNGGQGVYGVLTEADWLFAAGATMSGLTSTAYRDNVDKVASVPMWFFQGGQDGNPTPAATENTIRRLKAAGGSARYSLYPSLGHGTWNTAYAEPDFFSWFLSHNKSNIHVYNGTPFICGITGEGAKLGLSKGFFAYQWERNGVIIPDAHENIYLATVPGVYRARFSRVSSTPAEHEWNRWSDPVDVTEVMPARAVIEVTGSTHLRGPDNINSTQGNTVILKSKTANEKYYWYRNGVLDDIPSNTDDDTVRVYTITSTNAVNDNGLYTLRVSGFDNCLSPESEPVQLFFANSAPALPDNNLPGSFEGRAVSESSILLTWSDQSRTERGYEIWRRKPGENFSFIKLTHHDDISFLDTKLESSTTYEYKIRAVNNAGRTNYVPANALNTNLSVATLSDTRAPLTPQNLTAISTGVGSIRLQWTASADTDIAQYYIYVGADSIGTASDLTNYTFNDLPLNKIFRYTVKAVDFGGNFSPYSNQAVANTYSSGLFYKHSTGEWSDLTEMTGTWVNPEFTGTVANFTLAPRTQEDFFNFEFSGFIYINTGGNYQFRTTSDDGSNLTLNNVVIVNNDGLHGNVTVESASVALPAGPQVLNVKYFESTGGQSLTVQYKGPDTGDAWVTIPSSALKSGTPPATPAPPAPPVNLTATTGGMTHNNLAWQYNGTNPNGLKIVVLGSSTAEGEGSTPGNDWVNLLTNWITSTSTGSSVINLGKGGFNTTDVMADGSTPAPDVTANITKALSLNPDIILVNLPTNDVADNIPLTTTMANFSAIKELADASGVTLFLTTSQPRNSGVGGSTGPALLAQTAMEIRNTFGAYVIDIYDELTDFSNDRNIKSIYHSGDGVHLNDAGHQYIFETTRSKLIPYLTNFEIHSALSSSGPFTMISKTAPLNYQHRDLLPGTTYYYKIRTSNINGVSAFTSTVSAKTSGDAEAPTQPVGLTVTAATFSNVSLIWTKSNDNVNVIGYEVWANGILLGTSPVTGYQATGLASSTNHSFYVIAYDASGNRSVASAIIQASTSNPDTYYSKSSGSLTLLSTWGKNSDGSGDALSGFDINGIHLQVANRTSTTLDGAWSVEGPLSKVIVSEGTTLNVNSTLNARVELRDNAILNLNHASAPILIDLAPTSTVNYNGPASIQRSDYGHLGLSGGTKTFDTGTTIVLGNITGNGGASLRGAVDNQSKIRLSGNLTHNGTPETIPSSLALALELNKNGDQTISTKSDLVFFAIRKTGTGNVVLNHGGSPVTVHTGSSTGGGLLLDNGTKFDIGENTLLIEEAGSINAAGQTGQVTTDGGNINITSSSSENSNLYFDGVKHLLKNLHIDFTGTGQAFIRNQVSIAHSLKVKDGTLGSNGNITLLSTETGTANIEEIENDGRIEGDVTVQRLWSPGRLYRDISSPVEGVTIADWQTSFPITGNFAGASPGTSTPSLFYYAEPTGWVPYPATNAAAPVEKGKGYAALIQEEATPTLIVTTGNPYQGNIPFILQPGSQPENGWNLLGNPYASPIVWSTDDEAWINKNNVSSVVAIRNNISADAGQFLYYDALTGLGGNIGEPLESGEIAPGQAFWIRSIDAAPSLTITEKAKVNSSADHPASGPVSHLRIRLSKEALSDAGYIAFTNYGNDTFDKAFDGVKRENEGIFALSSLTTDDHAVAINNMSALFCAKTVRLHIGDVTPGLYELSFDNALIGIGSLILEDAFTDTSIDLMSTSNYSFTVTTDPESYGSSRFSLSFARPATDLSIIPTGEDVCETDAGITLPGTQNGAAYEVVNEEDQVISEAVIGNGSTITIVISREELKAGLNTFRIRAGFEGCNNQILDHAVTISYTPEPIAAIQDVSVCLGSPATLQATGAPVNGSYKWYTSELTEISGVDGSTYETEPVIEETYFMVAAVANGCEGPKQFVYVVPEIVETPSISVNKDTLFTHAIGNIHWWRNGEVLENETKNYLVASLTGAYTVSATSNGCTKVSAPVDVVITGHDGDVLTELNGFIYPNPVSHNNFNIKVDAPDNTPVRIRLIDILGHVLLDHTYHDAVQLKGGVHLIPNQVLGSGIYFIVLNQGNQSKKLKVIIKE